MVGAPRNSARRDSLPSRHAGPTRSSSALVGSLSPAPAGDPQHRLASPGSIILERQQCPSFDWLVLSARRRCTRSRRGRSPSRCRAQRLVTTLTTGAREQPARAGGREGAARRRQGACGPARVPPARKCPFGAPACALFSPRRFAAARVRLRLLLTRAVVSFPLRVAPAFTLLRTSRRRCSKRPRTA